MKNLKNSKTNEQFSIQNQKYLPFLKDYNDYQLKLLLKYEIINDEIYATLVPYQKEDSLNMMTSKEQIVAEIIKHDKFRELQCLILEKGID